MAQDLHGQGQTLRQKKWHRPAIDILLPCGPQKRLIPLGRGRLGKPLHQARRNHFTRKPCDYRERRCDHPPRDSHTQATGDELIETKNLIRGELLPPAHNVGDRRTGIAAAQTKNGALDPGGKTLRCRNEILLISALHGLTHQQGNRLGQVAHRLIALLKGPGGQPRDLHRRCLERRQGNQTLEPFPRQKPDRPGRIGRAGRLQVSDQGLLSRAGTLCLFEHHQEMAKCRKPAAPWGVGRARSRQRVTRLRLSETLWIRHRPAPH